MDAANEIAICFRHLSGVSEPGEAQELCVALEGRLQFVPERLRPIFGWYVDYCKNIGVFPSWEDFRHKYPSLDVVGYDEAQAARVYGRVFAIWELDFLADRLKRVSFAERSAVVGRMAEVLDGGAGDDGGRMVSDADLACVEAFTVAKEDSQERFRFPIRRLNEVSVIRPGSTIAVLAAPGSGKTQFCLNIAYVNSVKGGYRTLYIYLENLPASYEADLLSRYSFDLGVKVENAALKRGILEDDEDSVRVLGRLVEAYKEGKRGEIYFKAFTDYPTDPLRFASRLAQDIRDCKVDIVVFDYLQRAKALTPLQQDSMGYLNQLMSVLSQVALGGFNAPHPVVCVVAVQPNRDAMARAIRTKGDSLNITAVAEVNSVERDCFFILGLYKDADTDSTEQINYKIIKNRDNVVDAGMTGTVYFPRFCFIGDLVDDEESRRGFASLGDFSVGGYDELFSDDGEFGF